MWCICGFTLTPKYAVNFWLLRARKGRWANAPSNEQDKHFKNINISAHTHPIPPPPPLHASPGRSTESCAQITVYRSLASERHLLPAAPLCWCSAREEVCCFPSWPAPATWRYAIASTPSRPGFPLLYPGQLARGPRAPAAPSEPCTTAVTSRARARAPAERWLVALSSPRPGDWPWQSAHVVPSS